MTKFQGIRRRDGKRLNDLSLARQDVQDDVGRVDAFIQGFRAGSFDCRQTIAENRGQDLDHLPVAIVAPTEFVPDPGQAGRQHPILERGAITKGTGFTSEHWHIVPRIVDCLIVAEGSRVLADGLAVLADLEPIGIGANLDGTPDGAGHNRVFVAVKAYKAGLGD